MTLTSYNTRQQDTLIHQITHDDFSQLVASYMPAAGCLRLSRDDVEEAIKKALRFKGRCPSCKHSRAPGNALIIALVDERLPIHERSCNLSCLTGLRGCRHYEELILEEILS